MRLRLGDREVVVDQRHPQVAIGRAEESDLVVRGNLISRLHARVELNRNRFLLTDQSTNGTFVQMSGQEDAFVRRDSIPIKGDGMIGLGRAPDRESALTIRFFCEDG
jgi:predicted component of type VI protein secretion system